VARSGSHPRESVFKSSRNAAIQVAPTHFQAACGLGLRAEIFLYINLGRSAFPPRLAVGGTARSGFQRGWICFCGRFTMRPAKNSKIFRSRISPTTRERRNPATCQAEIGLPIIRGRGGRLIGAFKCFERNSGCAGRSFSAHVSGLPGSFSGREIQGKIQAWERLQLGNFHLVIGLDWSRGGRTLDIEGFWRAKSPGGNKPSLLQFCRFGPEESPDKFQNIF